MSLDQSLFPSIGAVAQTTDDQTDALDESQEDDGDRPMQEIDSLCMTCHEQVSLLQLSSKYIFLTGLFPNRVGRVFY